MNPCAHHHPTDALAAHAADAVDDPGERRAIENHLARCPACRTRLAAHERVLASLVEDEAPPPSLWDGIAARVAGPPAGPAATAVLAATPLGAPPARPLRLVGSARPSAAPPGPPRRGGERRHPGRLGLVAAAAALVAAAAAAPLAVTAWHRPGGVPGPRAAATRTAAVLDDVTGRDMARVVVRGGATYVVLDDLPPLPAERTYQLWSLDGPRPGSLGVLGRGAARSVPVTLPPGVRRVAISDEPAGGSPEPTTAIAGTGRLS